jgi:hypothetical protein
MNQSKIKSYKDIFILVYKKRKYIGNIDKIYDN